MGLLVRYCQAAPGLVAAMENDPERELVAQHLLDEFLVPARLLSNSGSFQKAVEVYKRMISYLNKQYH